MSISHTSYFLAARQASPLKAATGQMKSNSRRLANNSLRSKLFTRFLVVEFRRK
jgi:hypothetical protein